MRVLVTGNMGYVGPVLTAYLRGHEPGVELAGYDAGLFAHALTGAERLPETRPDRQVIGDVRDLPPALLEGVDAVVHLAAVSNDPMGDRFADATEDINQRASLRLAEIAAAAGVRHFVFASSCSIYGHAEGGARREGDPVNPLTAYARSKVGTENALRQIDHRGMTVTSLRFATACGMSDRLRLDLVLNDFVACAVAAGEITVLSDGSPWRPLIDVEDMARAIHWAITRDSAAGGQFLAVNAGSNAGNYQVRHLAEAVAGQVPGTRTRINAAAPPDRRSYKVDFSLFAELAPAFVPRVGLDQSIIRLRDGLTRMGFSDRAFRGSAFMRLKVLDGHLAAGRIGADLRWREPMAAPA